MGRTNLLVGCVLLILSLFALLWLIPNYTTPATSELDIPAGFVPSLACSVIAILSLALVVRSVIALRSRQERDERDHEEFRGEVTGLGRAELFNILIWICFSVAVLIALKYVGFLVAAPLLLAGTMFFAGCRRMALLLPISIGAPLLLDQVVWYAFTVRLP